MNNALLSLCGTKEASCTARNCLVLHTLNSRATHRTRGCHHKLRGKNGALFKHGAHDLRDHIARAAHNHRVSDAYILTPNLILVVQCCIGHRHPANKDRCEPSNGGNRTRTTNLNLNIQKSCRGLLCRKLVCNRKAGCTCHKTQYLLRGELIDFVHHPVDVIGQARATRTHLLVIRQQIARPLRHDMLRDVHGQA